MSGLYLAALLGSFTGVALIDHRWRLAFFARPRATTLAVLAGALVLLTWDLIGISEGIFRIGDSPAMLGVELAPHLPPEELVFVTFLPYCSLVAYTAASKWFESKEADR